MEAILQAKGISKKFGNFYALDHVDFEVYPGEVNVLIGENGAGKSTLLKILSGIYDKTDGEIIFDGKTVDICSPNDAEKLGISMVYQEISLVPQLSIAENVFLGNDLKTNRFGKVQWKKLYQESREILKKIVDLDVDTRLEAGKISVAHQQMVEIARAVHRNGKVLILDEPTAMLTQTEVARLFEVIHNLKEQGVAIIYISHRLEEIFEIGDRVTVLRDGKFIGTAFVKDITEARLINMMVGRSIEDQFSKGDYSAIKKKEVIRVEHLHREGVLYDVNLQINTGEVLGMAGLVGAGRTEIARCLFGADKMTSGQIYLNGAPIKISNTEDAVRYGIALLPENRKEQGLVVAHSIRQNMTIVNLQKVMGRTRTIQAALENEAANDYVQKLKISTRSIMDSVGNLSGGNQQKVVIAKWMFADANVIIFDEPTRGIDVGAKKEVYSLISEFVKQGKAVVVISSDMPELIGICDRIVTIREGRVTGEFHYANGYNQDQILKNMMAG